MNKWDFEFYEALLSLFKGDYSDTIHHCRSIMLATPEEDTTVIRNTHSLRAESLLLDGQPGPAKFFFEQSEKLFKHTNYQYGDLHTRAINHYGLGEAQLQLGDRAAALSTFSIAEPLLALTLTEKHKYYRRTAHILSNSKIDLDEKELTNRIKKSIRIIAPNWNCDQIVKAEKSEAAQFYKLTAQYTRIAIKDMEEEHYAGAFMWVNNVITFAIHSGHYRNVYFPVSIKVLSQLHFHLGMLERAKALTLAFIKSYETCFTETLDDDSTFVLAQILTLQNKYSNAIPYYEETITKLEQKKVHELYRKVQKTFEKVRYSAQLIERSKTEVSRGWSLVTREQLIPALSCFKRAENTLTQYLDDTDPCFLEIQGVKSFIYTKLGDEKNAAIALKKAQSIEMRIQARASQEQEHLNEFSPFGLEGAA